MNFLAHAWLVSAGSDDFLFGNLIADGVKGRDLSDWPAAIAQGVRHHRRVDAWVDSHPSVVNARRRAPVAQRRYAGIALDMLWDHFLARDTAGQAEQDAIVERCYRLLSARPAPNRLATMMPVLVEQDWLRGYADFNFTCRAITGIGRRLSGPNQLAALVPWLDDDYQALEKDFQILWPALLAELSHTDSLP
ncbi:acyl carrier protein phosphodiesterase [Vreelandella sp. V005]|uniref:acyl carrier protein phosphodiesterase n=1 Tax=Vreelandella sp. V005 TaxID=3459608 RepID=UPI004044CB9F